MALILNIDTAVETASVCLAENEKNLHFAINYNLKDHASWLHPAIQQLLADCGKNLQDIDAIAVSIGPGSYTGLRVGLSAAKGLCYALKKPLIAVGTLEMMANAVDKKPGDRICPVIDARRMEIFMALYDENLQELISPSAIIVESNSFMTILEPGPVIFVGNAVNKLSPVIVHPNAIFNSTKANATHISTISSQRFYANEFESLAYIEPLYIKEFHSNVR